MVCGASSLSALVHARCVLITPRNQDKGYSPAVFLIPHNSAYRKLQLFEPTDTAVTYIYMIVTPPPSTRGEQDPPDLLPHTTPRRLGCSQQTRTYLLADVWLQGILCVRQLRELNLSERALRAPAQDEREALGTHVACGQFLLHRFR